MAQALVAHINELPGWSCERRATLSSMVFDGRLAVVNILGESKRPESQLYYECTLRLGVTIIVKREDVDSDIDGRLEMRYLDRCVAEIEAAVHAIDWPLDSIPTIEGHEVQPPDESNLLSAGVQVTIPYRHNFDDPTAYSPAYA